MNTDKDGQLVHFDANHRMSRAMDHSMDYGLNDGLNDGLNHGLNDGDTTWNVAVVGAGAAGTVTAMRLLRNAAAGSALRIWLIGPAATGRGLAFGTDAPHHLLNVRASGMSAHWDDPEHFVRWLAGRGGANDFAPRGLYGRYLADSLEAERGREGKPHLARVHDRVTGITFRPDSAGPPLTVELRNEPSLAVDAAVLALGNLPPDPAWAPPSLRDSAMFVADPWSPGVLDAIPDDQDVLLVGTGLTMVDMALTLRRPGRVVHTVSRRGLVPQPHATSVLVTPSVPDVDARLGLGPLRRAVLRHVARCRREHGDWRSGVDSLRPVTAALWQQLPPADRARFLREDLRLWEAHRHRIPPTSAQTLREAVTAGLVTIGRGTVADVRRTARSLHVRLDDGRDLRVGAVVNCTGCPTDVTRTEDPLITGLLAAGMATPTPIGGGFQTTPSGRLRPAPGRVDAPLWTLGSLRRGDLLETTAMPEIRRQADDLAQTLLSRTGTIGVSVH